MNRSANQFLNKCMYVNYLDSYIHSYNPCGNRSVNCTGLCDVHKDKQSSLQFYIDINKTYVVDKLKIILTQINLCGLSSVEKSMKADELFKILSENMFFLYTYNNFKVTVYNKLIQLKNDNNMYKNADMYMELLFDVKFGPSVVELPTANLTNIPYTSYDDDDDDYVYTSTFISTNNTSSTLSKCVNELEISV